MTTAAPGTPGGAIQWVVAPVVALAAFMEIMDISIANVALPHIAGALSSSQNESTWVLTSYLVTNAIIMPISGWLANTFGRKRLFITCIAGFTVSSLLCGLAPNLPTLILLRALQGATGGGLQPVGQAILADSFPPEKRGMASAIYGVAAVVAPTVGPTLGGWITDNYDWRWIFLINVPVGIALILLVQSLIRDKVQRARGPLSVDWLGFGFVALSLGCLQVVLDRGQDADWFGSTLITILTITSASAFVLLAWRETHHGNPMVDLKLMKNPDFAVTFVLMLMLGFMLFGSTFLIPAYTQQLMGYRAIDAGMVLTPGGIVTILLLPFVGRSINKVDLRILTGIGLVIGAVSLCAHDEASTSAVSFRELMMLRMLQSAALPFLFVPINAMAFRGVPPEKTNNASALINLARNFGGSIGIAFASTLLTRREQFHQSRLVEHLQPLNPSYPDYAHGVGSLLGVAPDSPTALAGIYQTAIQQATLLSYLDDFKVLAILFLALVPLLLLVKAGKGGGRPVAGALTGGAAFRRRPPVSACVARAWRGVSSARRARAVLRATLRSRLTLRLARRLANAPALDAFGLAHGLFRRLLLRRLFLRRRLSSRLAPWARRLCSGPPQPVGRPVRGGLWWRSRRLWVARRAFARRDYRLRLAHGARHFLHRERAALRIHEERDPAAARNFHRAVQQPSARRLHGSDRTVGIGDVDVA